MIMDIDVTTMTVRGQVVIPQSIRENGGLEEGERFLVYEMDDSIILKRVKNLEASKNVKELEKAFSSMWETAKARGITEDDVKAEIRAVRHV
ncbi:MAG: AbrB/MazE/SpoVT family DNA-binding domain-containing protein [Nanoarchaeota archaeon]